MKVIDAKSFDIPSDENDYDELVAFADTIASIPQFDAVPIDVLDKIRAEIERERSFQRVMDAYDIATGLRKALEIIDKYTESEVKE